VATRIRRILVAIRDLHHPPRIELRKAAQIARAAKSTVELFHVVDVPDRADMVDSTLAAHARTHTLARIDAAERRLKLFSRLTELRDLTVTCHANADYPPHEAIIRAAVKSRADLLIVATRAKGLVDRLLLRNTDWELIRQCPCPLLLVKSPRPYDKPVVLAAVDPFHTHSKPADLDNRLLEAGGTIARLFKGSLHVFHAYMPLATYAPIVPAAMPISPPIEVEQARTQFLAGELNRLAKSAGVPANAQHLHMGLVSSELRAAAKKTRAGIVVMGAISRSALRRAFIGNTAEDVLDKLTSDVLVVKPKAFQTNVAAREYKYTFAARGPRRDKK
jgi:universal stress protein E